MPSYDYRCPECEAEVTELRAYEDRDSGMTCQACLAQNGMQRCYRGFPGVSTSDSKHIPDAIAKKRPGYADTLEYSKLESKAFEQKGGSKERAAIQCEMAKIKDRYKPTPNGVMKKDKWVT